MKLGISGRLTRATIRSPLTPLLLLAALAAGLVALLTIPREEEPQISVPMVDITVRADGLKAPDAVELVTKPLETIVKGIDGVEHTYSQSQDDRVMVTARFLVGTRADDAILRVHEKIRANIDRIPVGIPEPLIVGRGINDVAIVVVTLSPKAEAAARYTDKDLYELAEKLRSELSKVENVGLTYIAGGEAQRIRVEPDPEKLSLYGVTLQQLLAKVRDANRSFQAGRVRDAGLTPNGRGRPDAVGRARHRAAAGDDARQSSGLRAGRRQGRPRVRFRGAPGLERRARGRRIVVCRAGRQRCGCQARRRQCSGRGRSVARTAEIASRAG